MPKRHKARFETTPGKGRGAKRRMFKWVKFTIHSFIKALCGLQAYAVLKKHYIETTLVVGVVIY